MADHKFNLNLLDKLYCYGVTGSWEFRGIEPNLGVYLALLVAQTYSMGSPRSDKNRIKDWIILVLKFNVLFEISPDRYALTDLLHSTTTIESR